MTNEELKGTLLARSANLTGHLQQRMRTLTLIEADVIKARAEVSEVEGQLMATKAALEDIDRPFVQPAPPAASK